MNVATLFEALSAIPDHRTKKGRRFPLAAIVAIALAAIRSGANDMLAIARWGRAICSRGATSAALRSHCHRQGKQPSTAPGLPCEHACWHSLQVQTMVGDLDLCGLELFMDMCLFLRRWLGAAAIGLSGIVACVTPADAGSSGCLAVASNRPVVRFASMKSGPLAANEARITFIGHATFLIESASGVRMVTDFNDYVRPAALPDIATMNRAHTTHFTNNPPAGIKHVLRGWNPDGGPVEHNITLNDVHVRNVPTNIRDWGGGGGAYGNSIFIFELAGLCIGHLGHLHHTLTPEQIAAIGQLDIVLVPVDGGYTMDVSGMIEVLRALKARLILPMHYFNQFTLDRFIERLRGEFAVEMATSSKLVVSQATMPSEPKVLVLPGN